MKPVKLLLKNCMNIGSEDAAGNSAFIFSMIESCKLNDTDPQDYLKHLFECILHVRTATRRLFCHAFINPNVKTKYFLADILILSAEKQPIKLSWRKIVWLH